MSANPDLPPLYRSPLLSPRLKVLLATADTATERNDRVLGVQCILQIFSEFDRAAPVQEPGGGRCPHGESTAKAA